MHTFEPSTFGFDSCVSEFQSQDVARLISDVLRFLFQGCGKTVSFKGSMEGTYNSMLSDLTPNNFIFLFGQAASGKSDLLNVMHKESLLSRFLEGFKEQVRFLRVSMFYMDQEHVIL